MNTAVIIVAGGSGLRMGADMPKQFLLVGGEPILMRTISAFKNISNNIIVALPKDYIKLWRSLCEKYNFLVEHTIVEGGSTRFFSVKSALSAVNQNVDNVFVHDGVRPFVTEKLFDRLQEALLENDAVIPVVPIVDSIREKKKKGSVAKNRDDFFAVQTPQAFKKEVLIRAYEQSWCEKFTDDASVVESLGVEIFNVEGVLTNIKITSPMDIYIAEYIIKSKVKNK